MAQDEGNMCNNCKCKKRKDDVNRIIIRTTEWMLVTEHKDILQEKEDEYDIAIEKVKEHTKFILEYIR